MISFDGINIAFSNMGLFSTSEPWSHPARTIDSYEIIYVIEGDFYIKESDTIYHLESGKTFILYPNVKHCGIRKSQGEVKFYWLHFYCDNFPKLHIKKIYSKNELLNNEYLFREIINIQQSENKTLADIKLAELLVRISEAGTTEQTKIISEIEEYIRVNSDEKISVSDIASVFKYNKDYLSRLFIKKKGVTLQNFIIRKRIDYIKVFLLNTNFSIKEIAIKCNFSHENNFVKFFKYNTKMTPSEYRNRHNNLHMNKK